MLGTTKTRTTPYHPKSDGMVERFNRTLETMLSAYVSDNYKDWDRQLPYVMMAYRATAHETTGFSPNMLMLGRETSTPLDLVYDMPPWDKTCSCKYVGVGTSGENRRGTYFGQKIFRG